MKSHMNVSENLNYWALPKYLEFLKVYSIIPSWQVPKSAMLSLWALVDIKLCIYKTTEDAPMVK